MPEEAAPAQGQAGPAWLLALLALALVAAILLAVLIWRKRREKGEE